MSRNFELLQGIGKEQDIFQSEEVFQAPEEPRVVPVAPAAEPTAPLNIGAKELEEVTKLVQRLFLMPGVECPHSVVFMSTEPGNGCSWMCARAAEVLAGQVTGTVCVVDANLRGPALHEVFGVPNQHGLSDALQFSEPIARFTQPLSRPNLSLLSSGSIAENGQTLVSSDRMRTRLAELRAVYDYVLIDTPAISVGNDAVVMGSSTDGVVLVLKANSSRREAARKAVQELQTARVRVLGAVLNQRTYPIPEAIYKKL
jgi:capsular exopolysaccharide synthesis family protein